MHSSVLRFSIWNLNIEFVTPVQNYALPGFLICIFFRRVSVAFLFFGVVFSVISLEENKTKTESPARHV